MINRTFNNANKVTYERNAGILAESKKTNNNRHLSEAHGPAVQHEKSQNQIMRE